MDMPSAKDLKKLADACRKAGIKSFKGNGIEFTLTEDAPPVRTRKKSPNTAPSANYSAEASAIVQSEGQLSEEDMLFWSTGLASEPSDNKDSAGKA